MCKETLRVNPKEEEENEHHLLIYAFMSISSVSLDTLPRRIKRVGKALFNETYGLVPPYPLRPWPTSTSRA